jgi:DNA repair protein SbcC/Rad50
MRIRKIALQNLNSLRGVHEVDFTTAPLNTAGIIAITGETGAGKSTLLDAILLALFHKTARKHEKEVVSYGQQEAWAELEFEVSDIIYRSRWEVKVKKRGESQGEQAPAQTSVMQLNEAGWQVIGSGKKELKSSKSEAGLIEQIIGLNFDQFCKSVILPQGEFAAFLTASESDRAAILERLTNTEAYGRIGTAAYEKHEEIKLELDRIDQRARELQIPTPDELKALEVDQTAQEAILTVADTKIAGLATELAWFDAAHALESKQQKLIQLKTQLLSRQEQLQPDLVRLNNHTLAKPFLPRIDGLHKLGLDLAKLQKDAVQADGEYQIKQMRHAELEQKLGQLKQLQVLAEQRVQALHLLVGPYQVLKERQQNKQEQFNALNATFVEQQKHLGKKVLELDQARQKQTQEAEKLQKTRDWLQQHAAFQLIASDYGALEIELQQLAKTQERVKHLASQIEDLGKAGQSNRHLFTEKLGIVEEAKAEVIARAEQQNTKLKAEGLQRDQLNHSIEELRALQFAYSKIREQQDRYLATLREIDMLREQQEFLLLEEQKLFKELLNLLDEQNAWNHQVQLRKDLFEQQTRLHFFATERASLRDGEPCPVCGALEHPAAHHQLALVNLAESDYQLAQNRLEALEIKATALQYELQAIQAKLGDQVEQGGKEATAAFRQLFEKSNQEEQLLGTLLGAVSSKKHPLKSAVQPQEVEWSFTFSPNDDVFSEVEASLKRQLDLRTFLEQDEHETEKLRAKCLALETEVTKLQAEQQNAEQRSNDLANDLKHATTELDLLQTAVNQRLEKYGISKELEPLHILSEVQKYLANWNKGNEVANSLEMSIRETMLSIDQLTNFITNLQTELVEKEAQLKELNQGISECTTELESKYQNVNPQSELTALTEQLHEAKAFILANTTDYEEIGQIMATMQGTALQRTAQIAQQEKLLQQETMQLAQDLADVGVSEISGVQSLVLSDAACQAIEEQELQLVKDLHACQSQLVETENALQNHQISKPTTEQPLLLEALSALKTQKEDALVLMGSIRQRFSDFDKLKKQASQLRAEADKVRKELNRWERMLKLIGSKDGNNFRKFAQGITLDNLIYHANLHLKRLFGRYKISRVPTSELELEIVDLFQSDHRRSIKTLSGGETFLISLALALGLSDLAGQKTRIQSVFIDEGFGSLDGQTLDTAIEALENLQAEGVTIGIISHIPALHERIGTRISVRKTGNGYSTIEV